MQANEQYSSIIASPINADELPVCFDNDLLNDEDIIDLTTNQNDEENGSIIDLALQEADEYLIYEVYN